MVFIVGFNKLNVVHVLLITCMLIGMQFPKFIARRFGVFVALLLVRDLGRYIALLIFLSGTELTSRVSRILKILGFDNDFSTDKLFYKAPLDWEIPAMIYFCYIQLHVYRYLESKHVDLKQASWCFVKAFDKIYAVLLEKLLIWIFYGVILLILAFQDVTMLQNVYIAVLLLIIVVHMWADIKDDKYRGYATTKIFWRIMSFYNAIVLLAEYMFCFGVYTVGVELSLSDEVKAIYKLVGFDFVYPTGSGFIMQQKFLPQFLIMYLGLFATSHIQERLNKPPQGIDVPYSYKIWYLSFSHNSASEFGLALLDIWSLYSFHILFLLVAVLALFWKFSGGMWLFLVFFGIHYCTLHIRCAASRLKKPLQEFSYDEKQQISDEQLAERNGYATCQRKATLRFLILFAALFMMLAQMSRCIDHMGVLVDMFFSEEWRFSGIYFTRVLEAAATYSGIYHRDIGEKNTFAWDICGYMLMLALCALEIRWTDWNKDRLGYNFMYVDVRKDMERVKTVVEPTPRNLPIKSQYVGAQEVPTPIPEIVQNTTAIHDPSSFKDPSMLLIDTPINTAKHKITIMTIGKTLFEHLIILAICFSAILKNSITEICFLPLGMCCLFFGTNLKSTVWFSVYSWFMFTLEYGFAVCNMHQDSVPQFVDDSTLRKVLGVGQWPLHKLLFGDSAQGDAWAYYFLFDHSKSHMWGFMADVVSIFMQMVYFQHFCSSYYSLTRMKQFIDAPKSEISESRLQRRSTLLKRVYVLMKNLFFVYFHISSLFILLILGMFSGGLICITYVTFCVMFMQFDLFSSMGKPSWVLPKFIRYVLKPFVFCDLVFQLVIQIPFFLPEKGSTFLVFLGMQRIEEQPGLVVLKAVMYCIVLYQSRISSSEQYLDCCARERKRTGDMVYIYHFTHRG